MRGALLLCVLVLTSISLVAGQTKPTGCYQSFDGNGFLDIPNYQMSQNFTVEMWIRFNTTSANSYYFSFLQTPSGTNTFNLLLTSGAALTGTIANKAWSTSYTVPVKTWFHLAWTYDYYGGFDVYMNGDRVKSTSDSTFLKKNVRVTGRLMIGQKAIASGTMDIDGTQSFVGDIDELRVWNITRLASDIKRDYAKTQTQLLSTVQKNLMTYFSFDDCPIRTLNQTFGKVYTDLAKRFNAQFSCIECVTDTYGEYRALDSLYRATNGNAWTTDRNWTLYTGASVNPCSTKNRWWGVVCSNGRIVQLNLGYNKLTGSIPDVFQNFTMLRYLYLQGNTIGGSIPPSIGGLTSLTHLYLRDNQLTGSIPSTIGNMASAVKILLFNNGLTGSIPAGVAMLQNLERFDASNNKLSGSIPTGMTNMSSLLQLTLNNNRLSGNLPQDLINHPSIKFLNLANNLLSGPIPVQTNQGDFQEITLTNNSFRCQMPQFMYQKLQYTMNVYNSSFWCPIQISVSVFGAACTPLQITGVTPSRVLNESPQPSVLTLSVVGLDGCGAVQCYMEGTNGTNGTFVNPSKVTPTTVECPFPATTSREAAVSIYKNGVQVSSNAALVQYYVTCNGRCSNATRGRCDQYSGNCICYPPYTGNSCEQTTCPKDCSGHGTCNTLTGVCTCTGNYTGIACSIIDLNCPNNCFYSTNASLTHGQCDRSTGNCTCAKRYWGANCGNMACPPYNQPYCNSHGTCDGATGKCTCESGWLEPNCMVATLSCPKNCTSAERGYCNPASGVCSCFPGFSGVDCSNRTCPNDCSKHIPGAGTCNTTTGVCNCALNYRTAPDCSVFKTNCTDDCNGHGVCNYNGVCSCNPGYNGTTCAQKICPGVNGVECSYPNGECNYTTGECMCKTNYTGTYCHIGNRPCPNDCTDPSKGVCDANTGTCLCYKPSTGSDCSKYECRNNCSGNGQCNAATGECACDEGWTLAPDCSIVTLDCQYDCNEANNGGFCNLLTGQCTCNIGYSSASDIGDQCTLRVCPGSPPCNPPHGVCDTNTGTCKCEEFYGGLNCGVANHTCAGDCSAPMGQCLLTEGRCQCYNGTFGDNCELQLCLDNCNGADHGTCNTTTGICKCIDGWQGASCNTKVCPGFCTDLNHGVCNTTTGVCLCSVEYTGPSCSLYTCAGKLQNCSGHGTCDPATGACICAANYTALNCAQSNFSCPADCSGPSRGSCIPETGACSCSGRYYGYDCSSTRCSPEDCNGNGVCNPKLGQCECFKNWTGDVCRTPNLECPKNCSDRGTCDPTTGACSCAAGASLEDCSGKTCPSATEGMECSGHGKCDILTGLCRCDSGWQSEGCNKKKPNTRGIALGAALGGAGVVAASATAFYFVREHQIKKLKAKKALKMKALSDASSAADAAASG